MAYSTANPSTLPKLAARLYRWSIALARERSRAKAIDYLYNYVTNFGNVEGLAVEYAIDLDEANRLMQRLHSKYPQIPIYLSRTSPVIGTHTGPGLIVVSVIGDRQSDA